MTATLPSYVDIVRAWASGEASEVLDVLRPEQRRVIGLIASGEASDAALASAGVEFVCGIKGVLPGQLRTHASALVKVDGEQADNVLRWKYSDEKPDRMGDIILQDGWDLANYKQNPVILWGHAFGFDSIADEPIGRSKAVWVEGASGSKALFGDILFAVEESERAARIYRLAKSGFVSAGSVGFQPKSIRQINDEAERTELGLGRYGVIFEKQELLEFSLCAVPANAGALQQSVKSGAITVADADELVARRTERDWERYMRRKARSFLDLGGVQLPTKDAAAAAAGTAAGTSLERDAAQSAAHAKLEARDDGVALALSDLSASQQKFAASLEQFGARLGELARAITDLGSHVSAPRASPAQPLHAAPAATASRDATTVAEVLSIIETMRAPKRR